MAAPAQYPLRVIEYSDEEIEEGALSIAQDLQLMAIQLKTVSEHVERVREEGFSSADRKTLIKCEVKIDSMTESIIGLNNRVNRLEEARVTKETIDDVQDQINHLRDFQEEDSHNYDVFALTLRANEESIATMRKLVEETKASNTETLRRVFELDNTTKEAVKAKESVEFLKKQFDDLDKWRFKIITVAGMLGGSFVILMKYGKDILRWVGLLGAAAKP